MIFDIEITEDIFNVPILAPQITRQNAYSNSLDLFLEYNTNGIHNTNSTEIFNTELNINDFLYRSIPQFNENSNNSLPQLKKHFSESNKLPETLNSIKVKRFKTF